nr:Retrovirus-related Pol polyprotein from transposon TNT 1-94 [Ipomoea batatas]
MENFLRSKELWEVIEPAVAESSATMSDTQKAALKLKVLKGKNYLFQAINRTVLETILKKDTSKDIWDSLKKKCHGNTKTKRLQLQNFRSEFETLQMKEGENFTEFYSRTMAIVNKLRIHGDKVEDSVVIEKILRSMTTKYNFVVCATEEGNDLNLLTLDELESSILVHERKLNRHGNEAEQALKVVSTQNQSSTTNGEKGYEILIKNGECQIRDENFGLIARVKMTENRMFPLYLRHSSHSCFASKLDDVAWLWHFRYSHLNFGGLRILQQKNMVSGLPQISVPSQVCEECVISKQHLNFEGNDVEEQRQQPMETTQQNSNGSNNANLQIINSGVLNGFQEIPLGWLIMR